MYKFRQILFLVLLRFKTLSLTHVSLCMLSLTTACCHLSMRFQFTLIPLPYTAMYSPISPFEGYKCNYIFTEYNTIKARRRAELVAEKAEVARADMVAKRGHALTCFVRLSLFLFALTLTSARQTTVQDIARKLKLEDNQLLRTEKKFKVFMENYGRNYSTREEYLQRLEIFALNMLRAAENQALDPTAIHGVTQFSDLTEDEFQRHYTGVNGGFSLNNGAGGVAPPLEVDGLPDDFDWREKGAVTEVKMQVHIYDKFSFNFYEENYISTNYNS